MGALMTLDELNELGAIRERLRGLEDRINRHEADSRDRSDRQDSDLRELTKTVSALSTTIATLTIRLGAAPASGLAGPIAAGTSLAGVISAAASWAVIKLIGGG